MLSEKLGIDITVIQKISSKTGNTYKVLCMTFPNGMTKELFGLNNDVLDYIELQIDINKKK